MTYPFLLNEVLRISRVYSWDPALREVLLPDDPSTPWPIVWLGARFSRKHILVLHKKPDLEPLEQRLRSFTNRLRWRWFFRNVDSLLPLINIRKDPLLAPKVFGKEVLPPELDEWCSMLTAKSKGAAVRALATKTPRRNCIPLTKVALQPLGHSHWCFVKCGRDGGWCIMKDDEHKAAHLRY